MEYTVKSESKRLLEWFQKEKTDKLIKDTINNETRDYIFFNKFDEDARVISNVNSFKDAINILCEEEGLTFFVAYEIFTKALGNFDENDIVGIVSLYNEFGGYIAYAIGKVYQVNKKYMITNTWLIKKIYDREEK